MKRRSLNQYEPLENRICLTVSAAVTDAGNLIVSGDADGPVEIRALDAETFTITDGDTVQEVTGVTGGIRVRITDAEPVDDGGEDGGGDDGGTTTRPTLALADELPPADPANDDSVLIDLGGESVDRICASLGSGNNSLVIRNGSVTGSIGYRGGPHDDSLTLAEDASAGRHISARLGHGNNDVHIAGDVAGSVNVRTGHGDDSVRIGANSEIGRNAVAHLGAGTNSVGVGGAIGGGLHVGGGAGDDSVGVGENATIGRSLSAHLGAGNNNVGIAGSVDGFFHYHGGGGDDSLRIAETGSVGRSAFVRLGTGANSFIVNGSIARHLLLASGNAEGEDTIDIAEDAVGGRTIIRYAGGHGPRGDGGNDDGTGGDTGTNARRDFRAGIRR